MYFLSHILMIMHVFIFHFSEGNIIPFYFSNNHAEKALIDKVN